MRTRFLPSQRVRRALARGCDRGTVAEIHGIAERTSWHKQRAQAYDFSLSVLERGGSESSRDRGDATGDDANDAVDVTVAAGPQQQLDAVADGGDESDDDTTASEFGGQRQVSGPSR